MPSAFAGAAVPVHDAMTATVGPGSRVTMHYTLQLKDGTVVDNTRAGQPVTLVIGGGELVDLLETRLFGMAAGEHRHVELSALETQRLAASQSVERLARTEFPSEMEIQVGQMIGFALPSGQEIPGRVFEITDTEVAVDFSHPLAGHDLVFDVEIISIEPA